jgi:hypothetical protein
MEILAVIGVLVALVVVMSLMERRVKTDGALFTGQASPTMRLLALLLGFILGGIFLLELTSSEEIHLLFPILAIALLGYGLGAGRLLKRLQAGEEKEL